MKSQINIALATDLGYLKQTIIVIESVLLNSDKEADYVFHILTDKTVKAVLSKYNEYLREKYDNYEIKVVLMDDIIGKVHMEVVYITKPTYYRLYLPELIEADRCIYLDSDVIVCDDLASLYKMDMKDCEIAGVIDIPKHANTEDTLNHMKKIEIPSLDWYVNAGILLMDLSLMRESGFSKKASLLVDKSFPLQDQDILNVLCYEKTMLLPLKYNVQVILLDMLKKYPEIGISEADVKEAVTHPVIIHYYSAEKPWEFMDVPLAEKWWGICQQTQLFDDFFEKYRDSFYYYAINGNKPLWKLEKYSELWMKQLKTYERIYVYGAGIKGKRTLGLLKKHGIDIEAFLVTSLEDNPNIVDETKVMEVSDNLPKDAVIIISMARNRIPEVRRALFQKGYYNVICFGEI